MNQKQTELTTASGSIPIEASVTIGEIPASDCTQDKEYFIRQAFHVNALTGYELLFRQYYGSLCSHAARYVYTREVAEDLVSEVFYTFWKNQAYLQINTSFRAYLFASVRYKALNYLKWEFFKEDHFELQEDGETGGTPEPDQILEYDELYMYIEKIAASLPPQCRKVFLLNRFEGKSYAEIAKAMGVSVKAIEGHMSKALAVFRKALTAYRMPGK
ncbi:hypothetical protein DYBT9623_04270 [Dyadobacter sp. CECT 9623]|uniref:RNA polymerase sigma-70 factor n=1 Tax=Dyadobacter linearis TaxID=2823330 RepID=A0ABN7RHK1_9BACT|nr:MULTISPECIES: RNA polymerase sigma-70 factor [unclassified Dyadobacter]MCE7059384.1 RNA polymerase sigma-70 factor [Dyadobacter sp. CY343]CAG5072709.1 hypothetical protein DYBT9623_04270 [Dyadobacter sp. CECT 9623]